MNDFSKRLTILPASFIHVSYHKPTRLFDCVRKFLAFMSATRRHYKPEQKGQKKRKKEIWSENRLEENNGIKTENIFHACI
jgi:hypothetical protein